MFVSGKMYQKRINLIVFEGLEHHHWSPRLRVACDGGQYMSQHGSADVPGPPAGAICGQTACMHQGRDTWHGAMEKSGTAAGSSQLRS